MIRFFSVNAANVKIDYDTLSKRSDGYRCSVKDTSLTYGQLALQGPDSETILSEIIDEDLSQLPKMHLLSVIGWD